MVKKLALNLCVMQLQEYRSMYKLHVVLVVLVVLLYSHELDLVSSVTNAYSNLIAERWTGGTRRTVMDSAMVEV